MSTRRTPPNLAADGRRLWKSVLEVYELRSDELLLLEKACRTADDCARLDQAVRDSPLLVTGSTGQQRHNPLLNEVRQTRALLAALIRQLALSDEAAEAEGLLGPTTQRAMTAARARWSSAPKARRGA